MEGGVANVDEDGSGADLGADGGDADGGDDGLSASGCCGLTSGSRESSEAAEGGGGKTMATSQHGNAAEQEE
jgi:hypothetical protein